MRVTNDQLPKPLLIIVSLMRQQCR